MKKVLVLAAVAGATALFTGSLAARADEVFSQDFNTAGDTSGWSNGGGSYGSITQVPNGTDGITTGDGSTGFALVNSVVASPGPYTFFGQPGGPYPGSYTASVDMYLDPSGWASGSGFDWDVAPSDGAGNYGGPDYIFHAYESATGQLLIDANYNSGNAPPAGAITAGPGVGTVTAAGWYTFSSSFQDVGGQLQASLSVTGGSGPVFSETMSQPGSLDGVDYGWFNFVDVGSNGLAIDNSRLDIAATPLPSSAGMGLAVLGGLGVLGLLRKRYRAA